MNKFRRRLVELQKTTDPNGLGAGRPPRPIGDYQLSIKEPGAGLDDNVNSNW